MALMLRGVFIAAGASAISRFGWILYLFGALLIGTAIRLALSGHQAPDAAARPPTGCSCAWSGGWYRCRRTATARAC